jgi:hypothetical protein
MLPALKKKISAARKKKKESAEWRDPRTLSCLVVAIASVVLLLLLAPMGQVEASGAELVHAHGGSGDDQARSVIEHSFDHGFALLGQTASFGAGAWDFMLVKMNSMGVELWTKTYGGSGDDHAECMIEHSIDQGFVLVGRTLSWQAHPPSGDFMIVKTNSVGVELWTMTYGGSRLDYTEGVIEHSIDNGFVLAGFGLASFSSGSGKAMIVKTNSVGVELWTKTYGGSGDDRSYSVIEHSIDQGLALAGIAKSFGAGLDDVMLVKIDSVGTELWTKTFGGASNDKAHSVIEHSTDQGFALAGNTMSVGAGSWDFMLLKTTDLGVLLWTKTFGGAQDDYAECVTEHSLDQGLLVAGFTRSYGTSVGVSLDMMLVKTNTVGVVLWAKTFGGSGDDRAYSVVVEHSIDKGLVLAGQTDTFGAGGVDFILVIQPSDGSSTGAGADATPTEGTPTLTENAHSITGVTHTMTEVVRTLVDASQTTSTTVVFANPSQSQSPSQSSSPSVSQAASSTQTATQSQSSAASQSTSPSGSQTATQTASQTRAASQSSGSSQTATQTASQINLATPSASVSASANVGDPCDDHLCASGAGCVVVDSDTQYMCDCTAISTADVRAVGQYCNTTVEGKPVSVGSGNCPDCESAFVCTDSYTSNDPESFMEGVIPLLAAAACSCANPPQALLDQFGAVQHQVQDDNSMCMEFTIYSGNPNISASDIVEILEDAPPDTFVVNTNRLADFEPCDDEVDGCNSVGSGGDDSLVPIIIGVSAFCVVLTLGIVWYCLHKRVNQQFQARGNQVAVDAQEDVTVHVEPRASTAWAK